MMLVAEFKIVDRGDSCNYTLDTIEFGSLGNCLVWLYVKAKCKEKCLQSQVSVLGKTDLSRTCFASAVSLTRYRSVLAVVPS